MKYKYLILLFISIFFISSVYAVTLEEYNGSWFEGFESGSFTTNNWTLISAPGANNWTIATTDPYNGTYYAEANPRSTTEPASVMETAISTYKYGNITFSYYRKLVGLDITDEFKVKWYNGTDWIIVEETLDTAVDDPAYVFKTFNLPSSASNNPNFKIRFECTAGAASEYCRVDDIRITGVSLNKPPNITLNQPLNNTQFNNTQDINFNFTATDDYNTTFSCSIYLDGILNQTNNSVNNNTLTNFLIEGIPYGSHSWYINCTDGELSNVSETRYFNIADTISPSIQFVPPTEKLGSTINRNYIQVNVTASDSGIGLDNITVNLYNSTNLINSTTSLTSPFFVNFTNLKEGKYYFNATACDKSGNCNSTETRYVYYIHYIPSSGGAGVGVIKEISFDIYDFTENIITKLGNSEKVLQLYLFNKGNSKTKVELSQECVPGYDTCKFCNFDKNYVEINPNEDVLVPYICNVTRFIPQKVKLKIKYEFTEKEIIANFNFKKESTFKNIFDKIKEVFNKFIDFIKSLFKK